MSKKFDEQDRNKVISKVESYYEVNLSPVGSRHKFLEDESGKSYWIIGGYEDWHGIPSDMLQKEKQRSTDGILVIAKRHNNKIDIFCSDSLNRLINNKEKLSKPKKKGGCQFNFNIQIKDDHLYIKEVPSLTLTKLGDFQYTEEDKNVDKVRHAIGKLSPQERAEFLKTLEAEIE